MLESVIERLSIEGAILAIAVGVLWKEWRKSDTKILEMMEARIEERTKSIEKYQRFAEAFKELTMVLKG